ncbi:ankyrin repeat domain-containing protein [Leptospira bouyouniensis]|uniref:Ankyrin repeat domain-containing protein n=1 Tax=Leptospira bouyouniensis TaxID=2484911 RepID=A0A7I0IRS9_9LEPT|nr:ankyrin repeat domain-containing protein [Leptospira bouyouniensis]TGL07939.1 ankyrin repeat domain-containing protein [Leptospira bouyouniensis]
MVIRSNCNQTFVSLFILLLLSLNSIDANDLNLSQMRDPKTIKEKVNKAFDVNTKRNEDGYTLLHYAAELGNVDLAKFLISKGANLNVPLKDGNTPLATAINFSKNEIIRLLLEQGVNPNYALGERNYNRTHFHFFMIKIRKFDPSLFALFLTIEKDIDGLDKYGTTKLHSAILNEKYALIQLLLDAGANPQKKDKWGKTAIEFAERQNNPNVLKLLLKE